MQIYTEVLMLIGKMHAATLQEWKLAESNRRLALSSAYLSDIGTIKEKEARAEVAANPFRKEAALKEAETLRWKNAYVATQEMINVLKLKLKDLHIHLNNTN